MARRRHSAEHRVHPDLPEQPQRAFDQVYALVRDIPAGRVMTYGQISRLLLHRLSPAAVGWALHRCPEDLPWQRVVNTQGACSTERLGEFPPGWQRTLLEKEGVRFGPDGTLDLERYRHQP
ncbi:MAG: MGMT family protein [Pseudomonadota bacterium]